MKTLVWNCTCGLGDIFRSQPIVHELIRERNYVKLVMNGNIRTEVFNFVKLIMILDGIDIPIIRHKGISYDNIENLDVLVLRSSKTHDWMLNISRFGFHTFRTKRKVVIDFENNIEKKDLKLVCLFNSTASRKDFGSNELYNSDQNCSTLELIQGIVDKKKKEGCLFLVNTDSEYQHALNLGIQESMIVRFNGFLNLLKLFNMCKSILFVSNSGMHHFYGSYIKSDCDVLCMISDHDYQGFSYDDIDYLIFKTGECDSLKPTMSIDDIISKI